MKRHWRISVAEREVMALLWERSPLGSAEIVDSLETRKGWKPRTTRTLLDRLVAKKVVGVKADGRRNLYRPLVRREASIEQESRSFLRRIFGGEPAAMLISLVEQTDLSPEEIRQLKE
ncbi:MAG: BlaI/MecI/CopY family transcriptional regulator, partial [Verrucomicrobiales bacterium]|nr:BlaI/MecI/CopY family transcriptional regulator [Verrucomicrobiales bacterium]